MSIPNKVFILLEKISQCIHFYLSMIDSAKQTSSDP